MSAPTHTLVITRDNESLTHLSAYRPIAEDDVRDHYRARITCLNPEACDVWCECPKDGHCDPEDVDYEATVFHGVEHEWISGPDAWCIPAAECAAALAEWDLPDGIDTSVDGTYPVELEWDDEFLTVLLLKVGVMSAPRIFIRSGMTSVAQVRDWEWTCTGCWPAGGTYGYQWTIAAAADAGREHMRKHHGWLPPAESLALHRALAPLGPRVTVGEPSYSRRCGVRTASCAAPECVCAESDAEVARLNTQLGDCICNLGPGTEGPVEECPQHGRRYREWVEATDAKEAQVAELRAMVAAVRSVCQNTDGDWLDGDAEIPVGEVLRMLTLDGTRPLDGAGEQ